ncbi:hypothetical protein V2J09_012457 [Rumex salicifolius]
MQIPNSNPTWPLRDYYTPHQHCFGRCPISLRYSVLKLPQESLNHIKKNEQSQNQEMKFGKEFRIHLEESLPEWRDKFLCYKPLKKLLKRFPTNPNADQSQPAAENDVPAAGADPANGTTMSVDPKDERSMNLAEFQDWFVRLLNEELEKFNDFYVDKEEDFVIRFQELKERIQRVNESDGDGVPSAVRNLSEEMMEVRKEFVNIHGEMVLLKNYSSLNFAGLVKILKKYDKRTGGLLQLPFTQVAAHQPFITTESLTQLVRECEAKVELLFPLEEEVTEPTPQDPPLNDITNNNNNNPSERGPLGDANQGIYRSTLSAMRTIQGLRTSSTCNPLSFAALFRNEEDQGSGAVTAENSPLSPLPVEDNDCKSEQEDRNSDQ